MASQLNITISANTQVNSIDTTNQTILTSKGKIKYKNLVLALGADQIRIPISGGAANELLTVNDLEDYVNFQNKILDKKKVTILGAGLIGCEFANDLIFAGYDVDVIDMATYPLSRFLPESAGRYFQDKLADLGVNWHLQTSVQSIDHENTWLKVTLNNKNTIQTDVVLSAIGLRPRIKLAESAGIATRIGILVDRKLQTNLPQIYSIGDCAEVEKMVMPFVMPIMHAVKALASNLFGNDAYVKYPAMPVMVKTPALETIISPPAKSVNGKWNIKKLDDGLEAQYESDNGKLLGFVLMGSATAQRSTLTKNLPAILD
jgi:rubredoxin-NAD+ reductase